MLIARIFRFFILIIRFAFLLRKNRSTDLHRFYCYAMVLLDILEELGCCAALDFVILLRGVFLLEEGAVAPMGEWHHGVGGLGEVGDELLWVVE